MNHFPEGSHLVQIGETAIDISSSLDWRDEEGTVVAYLLVVSCFVEAAMEDDPRTAHVLSSVEPAIRSFRRFRDV